MAHAGMYVVAYLPHFLQIANIPWRYKDYGDVIKVEIWDVVDKGMFSSCSCALRRACWHMHAGKKRPKSDSLKTTHTVAQETDQFLLDAEFLDVFKGKAGVVV